MRTLVGAGIAAAVVVALLYPFKSREPDKGRPPQPQQPKVRIIEGLAGAGNYPSLYHQVSRADVILIGSPSNVIRQGMVPLDLPAGEFGNGTRTVWTVAVEKVLKGKVKETVKVSEPGGATGGSLLLYENSPRLLRGKRYVLFLKKVHEANTPYGFQVAIVKGKQYSLGDLDELLLEAPDDKLILENGVVNSPYDEHQRGNVGGFYDSDSKQILGEPEAAALSEITATVNDKDVVAWAKRMRQ